MFIHWGNKLVRQRQGYVADFCPMCRGVRPFELYRIGSAGHVYGITVTKGTLVGFEKVCATCRTATEANESHYKSVAKKFDSDSSIALTALGALTTATFPDLKQRHAARLQIEEDLKKNRARLDADTRHALLKEPFSILSRKLEQRLESTHIDLPLFLTAVIGVGFVALVAFVVDQFLAEQKELLPLLVAGAALVAIIAVVIQGRLTTRRYLRREIYPLLGRNLNRMNPSEGEIEGILREFRQVGMRFAARAKAKEIFAQVQRQRLPAH